MELKSELKTLPVPLTQRIISVVAVVMVLAMCALLLTVCFWAIVKIVGDVT